MNRKDELPKELAGPPEHLSQAARDFFDWMVANCDLDDAYSRVLLREAATMYDELPACREVMKREGCFTRDSKGRPTLHLLTPV